MTEKPKTEQIISNAIFPSVIVDENGCIIDIVNNITKFIKPGAKIILNKSKLEKVVLPVAENAVSKLIENFLNQYSFMHKTLTEPIRELNNSSVFLFGFPAEIDCKRYLLVAFVLQEIITEDFIELAEHMVISHKNKKCSNFSMTKSGIFEYDIKSDLLTDLSKGKTNNITKHYSETVLKNNIVHKDDIPIFNNMIEFIKNGHDFARFELRQRFNDGVYRWVSVIGKTVYDNNGNPQKFIGKITDIDYRKKTEEAITKRLRIDPLTGLYNKNYTYLKIASILEQEPESTKIFILIDINDFKSINKNLGHIFGDQVLLDVCSGIRDIFPKDTIIGRMAGDKFLVLAENIHTEKQITDTVEKISIVFKSTYCDNNPKNAIKENIGISIFPTNGIDCETLYKKAFFAMTYAKNSSFENYHIFSETDLSTYNNSFALTDKKHYEQPERSEEFNFEITEFAFEVMEGSRDVDSAINMLLNKVGKRFNLSRITIKEVSSIHHSLKSSKIVYQWRNKNTPKAACGKELYNADELSQILSKFDNEGMYMYTEGIDQKPEEFTDIFISPDTKSVLKFAFFDVGIFKGSITFDDTFARIWGKDEQKTLKIISKIISAYFLKMRAFREASEKVERLTGFDNVTGVMKYDKFKQEAAKILKSASSKFKYIILYSDFINFKYVNETYSYEDGDKILKDYAVQLTLKAKETIIMSRIYSDNFCILMRVPSDVSDSSIAVSIDKYNQSFMQLQKRSYPDFRFIVTCGVYVIKDPSMQINQIIDNANMARKHAKSLLSEKCILFNESMEEKMKYNIEILNSMERALENKEFKVVLQGKVNLKTGQVVGAEALVRWIKSDGTFISPIEFIPIFEKNGFVVNIDFFVYEEVCRFISERINSGKTIVPISVNVSRVHLEKGSFLKKICALTDRYKIPHNLLEFELTENIFLENSDTAINTMNDLKNAGFKVSMDDFGSGYSSLNLLKNLPVDVLKLDKGFLDNNDLSGNDEVVISSVIAMAKKMRIIVLCEGVETQQQVDFLSKAGCDLVQGYYFCRPISIPEFSQII